MAPPRKERKCEICESGGREFNKPDHLHRHMRSHTNERPYECDVCKKSFTRQDVLARHSKIHLDKEAEAVLEKPATNGNSASHSPSVEAYDSSGSYNPSQTAASTSKRTLEDYETASTPDRKAQSDVAPELYTADRTFAHIPFNGSFELDPIYGQVSEDRTSTMLASSQPFVGLSNAFWSDLGLGWNEETALAPPSAAAESEGRRDEALDRIAQLWPSALTANSSAPETSEPLGVPWAGMYARICAGIESQPITPPSTAFLTSAMRLYFANWSPDHPFMHEPTFKPQDHSPILSLAICAMGARWIEGETAELFSAQVFGRLASSLQHYWTDRTIFQLDMVRVGIIHQFYCLSSGDGALIASAATLQGGIVAHARQQHFFSSDGPCNIHLAPHDELRDAQPDARRLMWQEWVLGEETRRMSQQLYILEAYLHSQLRMDILPPNLVTSSVHVPVTLDTDKLFRAADAASWTTLALAMPPQGHFTIRDSIAYLFDPQDQAEARGFLPQYRYTTANLDHILCGFYQHTRGRAFYAIAPDVQEHYVDPATLLGLDRWRRQFAARVDTLDSEADRWRFGEVMMSYHAHNFKELFSREQIEIANGRDGAQAAMRMREHFKDVELSPSLRRALLHAAQALNILALPSAMPCTRLTSFIVGLKAALLISTFAHLNRSLSPHPTNTYDLASPVNWDRIGLAGVPNYARPLQPGQEAQLDDATRWIYQGGKWSFRMHASPGDTLRWTADRLSERSSVVPFGQAVCSVLRLRAESL